MSPFYRSICQLRSSDGFFSEHASNLLYSSIWTDDDFHFCEKSMGIRPFNETSRHATPRTCYRNSRKPVAEREEEQAQIVQICVRTSC